MSSLHTCHDFNPQREVSLYSFLKLCGQPSTAPGVSHDADWHYAELGAFRSAMHFSKSEEGLSIIEVGSGTGRIGYWLARVPEVRSYTGIEILPAYADYHREIDPGRDVRTGSIFQLKVSKRFSMACVPFTLLHMFPFGVQEVLIRKLLVSDADAACFDIILADWLPQQPEFLSENGRWSKQIDLAGTNVWFYSMPMSEYKALATELNVNLSSEIYYKKNTSGKPVQHMMLTFYR